MSILKILRDKITLKLVWKSIQEQRLNFFVGVHVLNKNGTILSQADYEQSERKILVKDGALWMEQTDIEREKLRHAVAIGIVIYSIDPARSLHMDTGPNDWKSRRLLIKLPKDGVMFDKPT